MRKRVKSITQVIFVLLMCVAMVLPSFLYQMSEAPTTKADALGLSDNAKKAINKNKYARVKMTVSESDGSFGSQRVLGEYLLYTERDSTDTYYEFSGGDYTTKQYWTKSDSLEETKSYLSEYSLNEDGDLNPDNIKDLYDIWIYSDEIDSYVRTYYDGTPITINTYSCLDNTGDYMLMDKTSDEYKMATAYLNQYADNECSVLYTIGSNDKYSNIIDYIFIDDSSYLPLLIVTIGTYGESSIKSGDSEVDDSGVTMKIVSYLYDWSNDNDYDINMPEDYISEKDYAERSEDSE